MTLNTERSQQNQLIRNLAGSLMLPQSLDQGLSSNVNVASTQPSTQQYVAPTTQNSTPLPTQSPSISSVSDSAGTSSSLLARRHSSSHIQNEAQTCNVRRFSCMRLKPTKSSSK